MKTKRLTERELREWSAETHYSTVMGRSARDALAYRRALRKVRKIAVLNGRITRIIDRALGAKR